MQDENQVLLRIRPALPRVEEEVTVNRGPLTMETALSALHSLKGRIGELILELGFADGKIGLFARAHRKAAPLVESQMYAQYPDAEIELLYEDPFTIAEGEAAFSVDLTLTDPEVFPIKRHPQFFDLVSRQVVDTLAGITSSLVRYSKPGMRGHVQIIFRPVAGARFRRRALRFLPLITRGLPKHWPAYAKLFTRVHLARGWFRRFLFLPLDLMMGGFRAWFMPAVSQVSLLTGEQAEESGQEGFQRVSARSHEREDAVAAAVDKVNRLLFVVNVRVSVISKEADRMEAEAKVEEIAGSFRQFSLPQCNGFRAGALRSSDRIVRGFRNTQYILSAEELATLWHIPSILVKTPHLDWVLSRKLEPPVDLPIVDEREGGELSVLGAALFRGERRRFGIHTDDRRRHIYIIGKTGMGKSTLLLNMIASDITMGRGVGLIDPHGDLVDATLELIPKNRSNEVILVEPSDREYPISFNMLACEDRSQQPLVASGIMSVFKKIWPDVWSGRMEYILRNAVLALLEAGGNSLLGILRMFSDDAFRKKVLEHTEDGIVKSFWEVEYLSWSEKYRTEAIAAIQNKIGQLLSVPLIRNIVGQVQSTLDLRHAMDTGKIVLVNLSKGKLGEDTSAFLGSMLVTKFQLDAMSRADVPENARHDFYLYVDEFQNFATESFASILSEARKYRLNLTMANQYVAQLLIGERSTALRDAVFGNVGSLVCFQVGSEDAEPLSLQFEEMVQAKDILSLPKYHAYMRLMIGGVPSKPFSLVTLPPPEVQQEKNRTELVRRLSRERYAQTREVVEGKIARWLATARQAQETAKSVEKVKEKEEEERRRAKERGMSLEDYRKWRDREMWMNEFNALRKKQYLGETLTAEQKMRLAELQKKLEESGGVPPPSKTMLGMKK